MKLQSLTAFVIAASALMAETPRIPDTPVIDQDGQRHSFYSDLVKGHTVAINFIFTTCKTICPPLAANFRKVQQSLGTNEDVRLISISVDPVTDTPERLKQFAAQFHAGPGWTLVTGTKGDIDALLGALGSVVRNKVEHTPMVMIGNEPAGYWVRADGLQSAPTLLAAIRTAGARKPESPAATQAAQYFPNTELLTQDGVPVRLFDDVLKGHTVLINFLFTTCSGVCPPMTANLAKVQRLLGDRVGRDIVMVSITVDPEKDTPAAMKAYAAGFGARPGWYFLTGTKENVDWVRYKLGGYTEDKNDHTTVVVIGNVAHGGWRKMMAMASPQAIAHAVEETAQ